MPLSLGDRPFRTVVDDVSFMANLLEHLDVTLNVERLRIYGACFSSGGEFCNWMAGITTGLLDALGHAWPAAAPFKANLQGIDSLLSHSR